MAVTVTSKWLRWLTFGFYNPDQGQQITEPLGVGTSSGVSVNDTRALQISAVWSCIRLISETVSTLPLNVYRRNNAGYGELQPKHWLTELIREPNPLMTGQEFRESLAAQIAAWGNAYARVDRNTSGRPVFLYPLKPAQMEVRRESDDALSYIYSTNARGVEQPLAYKADQILHIKGFGSDGVTGLSPLGFARQAMGIAVASEDYAGSFYASGGVPQVQVLFDKFLKPEQREAARKHFRGMADRGDGSEKLWIMEGGSKAEALGINPEDAQMLETRHFQISEIARFFRVPLFLIMDTEKSTSWGTGLQEQNLAFLLYSLRAYLRRIENGFNRWIIPRPMRGEYYVRHDVEDFLKADHKTLAEYLSTLTQNGLMTRNEGREKINLPPMKGGDELTAQVNLSPIGSLGRQPINTDIEK